MPVSHPFTERDLNQLRDRGISPERAAGHLAALTAGMPHPVLDRPCTRGDGITVLSDAELERLCRRGEEAARAGRLRKFVPASGAATRMFQGLLAARGRAADMAATLEDLRGLPEYPALREFMAHIERFAFHPELKRELERRGRRLQALRDAGRFHEILDCLLGPEGLGYGELPKAVILFHRYSNDCRTAVAEHLVQARAHVRDRSGTVRVHFTVSARHRTAVERHIAEVCRLYEDGHVRYEVTLSEQRPDTDTLAAGLDNQPFRQRDGSLLLRPGGHGALLANLNGLKADVVLIQNIDNIAVRPGTAIRYRKALAGYLVELQARLFEYLEGLHSGAAPSFLEEALHFVRTTLSVPPPEDLTGAPAAARVRFLQETLNRPLRVCGMVPGTGEPGGGPFWVRGADGALSLQIVESAQVDMAQARQRDIFASSTHFHPVDLVCGVRNRSGTCFDLMRFSDPDSGFSSIKSLDGRKLKALEHPGLWNGGMAEWNTVFVELPQETFTPVKTVLDLLRKEHLVQSPGPASSGSPPSALPRPGGPPPGGQGGGGTPLPPRRL